MTKYRQGSNSTLPPRTQCPCVVSEPTQIVFNLFITTGSRLAAKCPTTSIGFISSFTILIINKLQPFDSGGETLLNKPVYVLMKYFTNNLWPLENIENLIPKNNLYKGQTR